MSIEGFIDQENVQTPNIPRPLGRIIGECVSHWSLCGVEDVVNYTVHDKVGERHEADGLFYISQYDTALRELSKYIRSTPSSLAISDMIASVVQESKSEELGEGTEGFKKF